MKNIALFTPKIFYKQLYDAYTSLGYHVFDYSYGTINTSNQIMKVIASLSTKYLFFKQSVLFNELILKFLNSLSNSNVDLIMFIKGQRINSYNFERLLILGIPIVFWSTDSLSRVPNNNCNMLSTLNFYQDGGDCKNNSDIWLPLGIDTINFYPESKKKYDITFIGRIKGKAYELRFKYLKSLIASDLTDNYNVNIISNLDKLDLIRAKLINDRINYIAQQPYVDYAKYIRESKIVVNIHQNDGFRPITPLFFSIPYCNTVQIVDSREYFNGWLSNSLYITSTLDNFINNIYSAIENYPILIEDIKENLNFLSQHTMKNRIEFILNTLKTIK